MFWGTNRKKTGLLGGHHTGKNACCVVFRAQATACARGIARFLCTNWYCIFFLRFFVCFHKFSCIYLIFFLLLICNVCFCVVASSCFVFFCLFPPDMPVAQTLHMQYLAVLILLRSFCLSVDFFRHKNRCTRKGGPTACVHWMCCFGLVSCVLKCFCPVSFVFGFWWAIPRWCDLGCTLFPLFVVFVAGFLSCFFILRFLLVCHPCQISSPGPLWALQCLPRVPPHIALTHYAHPHHPWASMHLRSCVCACC